MTDSSPKPRRSTISNCSSIVPPKPTAPATKPGTCTHITMTRLWTNEFQCPLCSEIGGFGWVYRCTQDRELLIEHDMSFGRQVSGKKTWRKLLERFFLRFTKQHALDDIAFAFPLPKEPQKRSAAARMEKLSLLDEITEEQWHTYSPAQIATLLNQREHLHEVLAEANTNPPHPEVEYFSTLTKLISPSAKLQPKPWLSQRECQFKCCHRCRPTLRERSYLSLDGIANGDHPPTAITGFGFHLQGSRPLTPAHIVRNLGLRPSPPPRVLIPPTPRKDKRRQAVQLKRNKRNGGLGIINNAPETPPTKKISSNVPFSAIKIHGVAIVDGGSSSNSTTSTSNDPTFSDADEVSGLEINSAYTNLSPTQQATIFGPLANPQQQDGEEFQPSQTSLSAPPPPSPSEEEEEQKPKTPLTTMEEVEEQEQAFSDLPLEVKDGVAVTEEAVEQHVADVITQF